MQSLKALRWISRVALVFLAVAAVVVLIPPVRDTAVVLGSRVSLCSLQSARQWRTDAQLLKAYADRAQKSCRVIRREPAYWLWDTPEGQLWAVPSQNLSSLIAEQAFKRAESGPNETVKPGDTVLDCGANVGVFVKEALDRGASRVVAIEPSPRNIECLRRTFQPEIQAGRVVVYEKGVWDRDDVLVLEETSSGAEDSVVMHRKENTGSLKVPLTTIDKLVAELKLERVDYIKMDIEGAEKKALLGARQTLAKFRPRMELSINHLPDDPQAIPKLVRSLHPAYQMGCGPCFFRDWHIQPDIAYFY